MMSLKTFVKINTVNNLSDARYCAGMGVNLIGFCLEDGQPDYTPLDKFKQISEWLSGVEFVGEFEYSSINDIQAKLEAYRLTRVQVNDSDVALELKKAGYEVILTVELDALNELHDINDVDYLMVHSTDVPEESHVKTLKNLAKRTKLLFASGINEHNVLGWIEQLNAYGIALTAGDEIRPGYKDFDELADILELLEVET
ncbi:phosphoribosylanthranilate isomerase [Fulvivirga sp. M361]|uniref:phosphoribosylanthranilate isomerase n=1 Tax=Fulvivirga sp. M361 TaxID=2594266 RepID=UPI0011799B9F|nr:phosphoribosylanthranilate isomerase [Fulvivirga sp. M361]TRX51394.1 phosphoribosylanthranilate isomerase [Fulvivirga sp. M361]